MDQNQFDVNHGKSHRQLLERRRPAGSESPEWTFLEIRHQFGNMCRMRKSEVVPRKIHPPILPCPRVDWSQPNTMNVTDIRRSKAMILVVDRGQLFECAHLFPGLDSVHLTLASNAESVPEHAPTGAGLRLRFLQPRNIVPAALSHFSALVNCVVRGCKTLSGKRSRMPTPPQLVLSVPGSPAATAGLWRIEWPNLSGQPGAASSVTDLTLTGRVMHLPYSGRVPLPPTGRTSTKSWRLRPHTLLTSSSRQGSSKAPYADACRTEDSLPLSSS